MGTITQIITGAVGAQYADAEIAGPAKRTGKADRLFELTNAPGGVAYRNESLTVYEYGETAFAISTGEGLVYTFDREEAWAVVDALLEHTDYVVTYYNHKQLTDAEKLPMGETDSEADNA